MTSVSVREHRGWELVVLESDRASVEIVPGKGGDVLRFRWLDQDVDVLWSSPWGLRQRGAATAPGTSADTLIDWYPGGWQVMLPNAGDEVQAYGTTWGMHGEVWTTPFDVTLFDGGAELTARLTRVPIDVTRRFRLEAGCLTVTEHLVNRGRWAIDGVYGHHPAFAPGFAAGGRLTCGASEVVVDDRRVTDAGDLQVGGHGTWPHAPGRQGGYRDLRDIPTVDGPPCERMAYLTGFEEGWADIASAQHPLTARLRWDAELFPNAWLWTEYHGSPDFPWFGAVDAIAIEPCTGFPGQGRDVIAERTGLWRLEAGQEQTTTISLDVQEQ